MLKNKQLTTGLILIWFLAGSGSAAAYIETGSNRLIVEVTPPAPGVLEQFTIKVKSFYYDLGKETVSWTLNDKAVQTGPGKTELSLRAGRLGQEVRVGIIITDTDKILAEKTIRLIPGEVEILAEPLVYTSPFYRGRGQATAGSEVKLLAEANFIDLSRGKIPAEEIIYRWQTGNSGQNQLAGLGKNATIITIDGRRNKTSVRVTAEAAGGLIMAEKNLTIVHRPAKINFYEVKPLQGIVYDKVIKDGEVVEVDRDDFTVIAEPLFLPLAVLNNLKYEWRVGDNQTEASGTNPKVLTIFSRGDNQTEAKVFLTLAGLSDLSRSFTVLFAQTLQAL